MAGEKVDLPKGSGTKLSYQPAHNAEGAVLPPIALDVDVFSGVTGEGVFKMALFGKDGIRETHTSANGSPCVVGNTAKRISTKGWPLKEPPAPQFYAELHHPNAGWSASLLPLRGTHRPQLLAVMLHDAPTMAHCDAC